MPTPLMDLVSMTDMRFPTADEKARVLAYTDSLHARFEAARAVEEKERLIVTKTIEDIRRKYPTFDKFHDTAWGKCFRDVALTLRQCVQSMILDDVKSLDDKLLFWLRTMLASFHFTPDLNKDTYIAMRDHAKKILAPEHYALMEPYLERTVEVLSDFPVPAEPAV